MGVGVEFCLQRNHPRTFNFSSIVLVFSRVRCIRFFCAKVFYRIYCCLVKFGLGRLICEINKHYNYYRYYYYYLETKVSKPYVNQTNQLLLGKHELFCHKTKIVVEKFKK